MTLPLLVMSPSDLVLFRPLASSSPSSKVVALVDRDPWGEELRLCGGDGRLRWLVSTATDSALPLPFRKLGGDKGDFSSKPLPPPICDALGFFKLLFLAGIEALEPVDSRWSSESPFMEALEASGLLGVLATCFGGCGNAPMLTTLRSDFPSGGPPDACSAAIVGTEGDVMCFALLGRYGEFEYETARFDGLARPLEGVRRPAGPRFGERCFGTGSEGSGPVGGAMERRGSVLPDMLAMLASSSLGSCCAVWEMSTQRQSDVGPSSALATGTCLRPLSFFSFPRASLRRTHDSRHKQALSTKL